VTGFFPGGREANAWGRGKFPLPWKHKSRAHFSSVYEQPAAEVWQTLREFNNDPRFREIPPTRVNGSSWPF